MIVYVIIFLLIAFFSVEYELGSNKLEWPFYLIIFLLVLFAGFRGQDVSKDYTLYQFAFENIGNKFSNSGNDFQATYEPGFYWIVIFFKWIFPVLYPLIIMIFFSLIAIFLKAISFLRYSFNPFLVLLVYYSNFFFLHEMTQIRVGVAIGIFLISLQYYLKKQYMLFLLGILLATLFHYSAIIYLSIILFKREHFSKIWFAILMILTLPVGMLKIQVFDIFNILGRFSKINEKMSTYSNIIQFNLSDKANIFNPINLLNLIVTAYLLIIIPKETLIKDKTLGLFLKFNIVGLFLFSFFSNSALLAFRISELFTLSSVFLLPYLVRYLPFRKFNIWFVILIAFVYLLANTYLGTLIKPYHFYNI